MIRNYRTSINIDKSQQDEIKRFINRVEKFAKGILPKMGDEVKLFMDISELVGRGVVATLYFYGFRDMYDDEYQFERLNTDRSMEGQIGSIVKSAIGNYDSIHASTYWTAKKQLGKKVQEIGPYVEIEYSGNHIYESIKNLSESKAAKESKNTLGKLNFALNRMLGDGVEVVSLSTNKKIIDSIGLRVNKDNKKALSFVNQFNFKKVNNVGGINRPGEDEEDFLLGVSFGFDSEPEDRDDIARFIEYVEKKSGEHKIVSFVNEGNIRKVLEAKVESILSKEDAKALERTLLKAFKVNEAFKRSPKLDVMLQKFCDKYADRWIAKGERLKWGDIYNQLDSFFGESFSSFDPDKQDYILTYISIALDDMDIDSEELDEALIVKKPIDLVSAIKSYNSEYADDIDVGDKAYKIYKKTLKDKKYRKALNTAIDKMNACDKDKKVTLNEERKKDGSDWTTEEVMNLIQTNDTVLYGALKYLYNEQTDDEKNTSSTREHNGRGFNAFDAEFLTSLAQQVINKGYLSEKQKMYARKKLTRYKTQLTKLANR